MEDDGNGGQLLLRQRHQLLLEVAWHPELELSDTEGWGWGVGFQGVRVPGFVGVSLS